MPPQQQAGWAQQPQVPPQQQAGWGQQPQGWAPQAERRQSSGSSRPFLIGLLIILIAGLGFLTYKYTPLADTVKGFFGSGGESGATNTAAPTISKVKAVVSGAGALITWTTDKNASSQVEYGKTTDYGLLEPATPDTDPSTGDSLGVVTHSVTLSGLEPGSTYHYRVKSLDKDGQEAVSPDETFEVGTAE